MLGFFRRVMMPLRAGVIAVFALVAPASVNAAVLLPATSFSYDGLSNTVLEFSAPSAGTLTFSLLLPAASGQQVTGAFTAIISSPGTQDLSIVFNGESYNASERNLGQVSFGDLLFNDPEPYVLNGKMVWSALAAAGDYQIDIFSVLTSSFTGFAPTIAVDFEASVNPVPLPGALPLFASGLGLAALTHWRRRRKRQEPAAV